MDLFAGMDVAKKDAQSQQPQTPEQPKPTAGGSTMPGLFAGLSVGAPTTAAPVEPA